VEFNFLWPLTRLHEERLASRRGPASITSLEPHRQKEESDVSLTDFEEPGGVGDTYSGRSQHSPSGGTILPTSGKVLQRHLEVLPR
jgi:hypothetical protein